MIEDADVYTIGHSTRSLEGLPVTRSSQRVRSDPFALPLFVISRPPMDSNRSVWSSRRISEWQR